MFFRLPTLNLNLDLRSIQFVPFCNISYTSNNISAATIILKNFFDILFTSEIYFICISYNIFLYKSFNILNNRIYFLDILTFLIHNDKIINVRGNITPLPSLSLCLFVEFIIAIERHYVIVYSAQKPTLYLNISYNDKCFIIDGTFFLIHIDNSSHIIIFSHFVV